jgi:hypothetical protein
MYVRGYLQGSENGRVVTIGWKEEVTEGEQPGEGLSIVRIGNRVSCLCFIWATCGITQMDQRWSGTLYYSDEQKLWPLF